MADVDFYVAYNLCLIILQAEQPTSALDTLLRADINLHLFKILLILTPCFVIYA